MKACESYIELMMKCIDEDASPEELAALHTHLDECEVCRALYESYLAVDAAVHETEEEPPEQLHAAIMRSVQNESAKQKPGQWLHRYRFTAIAAILAVVVLVGARVVRNAPSSATGAAQVMEERAEDAAAEAAGAEGIAESQEAPLMAAIQEAPAEPAEAAEEAEAPVPAPEELPTEDGKTADDSFAVTAESGTVREAAEPEEKDNAFAACTDSMRSAGYVGRVLQIAGVSREELEQAFPELTEVTLSDGVVIYEIQAADVETVLTQFQVTADCVLEPDSPTRYFIFLEP